MATYYADSVFGKNTNPGTKERPKLTAAAAYALVTSPADTLSLSGVFRETLTLTVSGFGSGINYLQESIQKILGTYTYDKSNIPVVITSTDPENPAELTGFKVITAFDEIDGNGNYKTTAATYYNPMFVRINGQYAKHGNALTTLNPGEWFFENLGSQTGRVYVNVDPRKNIVEIPDQRTALEATGVNAVVIDNIKYTGNRQSSTAGMRFINCTNILAQNINFSGCWKALDFVGTSDNCVAAFNNVSYCGDGLDTNAVSTDRPTNILFYGNTCTGLYDLSGTYWLANAITTGTIAADHEGIACTGVGDNIYFVNNVVKFWNHNIGVYSAHVSPSNWNILQNKIESAFDDGLAASAAPSMTISDLHIVGNLFLRNGILKGISNIAATIPSSVQYVEFCNNTLIENANGIICSAVAGKTINNIFYEEQYAGNSIHIQFSGVVSNDLTLHEIDNNRYFGAGGFYKPGVPDVYYTAAQFSNWKAAATKDVNSLQTNPNLDANYVPTDTVCIAAGAKWFANKARPVDFNGNALPDIALDIGCFQQNLHKFHPLNLKRI